MLKGGRWVFWLRGLGGLSAPQQPSNPAPLRCVCVCVCVCDIVFASAPASRREGLLVPLRRLRWAVIDWLGVTGVSLLALTAWTSVGPLRWTLNLVTLHFIGGCVHPPVEGALHSFLLCHGLCMCLCLVSVSVDRNLPRRFSCTSFGGQDGLGPFVLPWCCGGLPGLQHRP